MGRGGHYIYVVNEDGTRSRGQWVSNKTHNKMMEAKSRQSDLMSQRRRENEEQAAGTIRVPIPTGNSSSTVVPNRRRQWEIAQEVEANVARSAPAVTGGTTKREPKVQLDPDYKKEVNKLASQIRAMLGRGADVTEEKIIEKLVDIASYDDNGEESLWQGLNDFMYYNGRGGIQFQTKREVNDFIDSIENRLGISLRK